METIYWSQIKKAKKDIYVNIIAKGEFTKGDIIEHPIKKIKREDDSLYIDIDGIPAGNDLTFFLEYGILQVLVRVKITKLGFL